MSAIMLGGDIEDAAEACRQTNGAEGVGASRLAVDMQAAVQSLASTWHADGCAVGFRVGIAIGSATVGTLGWHGRLDYTAIGNVVNLASRLCDLAEDAQILVDPVVTAHVKDSTALHPLESGPSRVGLQEILNDGPQGDKGKE